LIFENVSIAILDETAMISAYSGIFDADIPFINTTDGVLILGQFKSSAAELLGQDNKFGRTSHNNYSCY
jgi:hypothetical protein